MPRRCQRRSGCRRPGFRRPPSGATRTRARIRSPICKLDRARASSEPARCWTTRRGGSARPSPGSAPGEATSTGAQSSTERSNPLPSASQTQASRLRVSGAVGTESPAASSRAASPASPAAKATPHANPKRRAGNRRLRSAPAKHARARPKALGPSMSGHVNSAAKTPITWPSARLGKPRDKALSPGPGRPKGTEQCGVVAAVRANGPPRHYCRRRR